MERVFCQMRNKDGHQNPYRRLYGARHTEELVDVQSIERTPFKEIFEEYVDLCKEPYNMNYFRKNRIEIEKPLVKEAYEKRNQRETAEDLR